MDWATIRFHIKELAKSYDIELFVLEDKARPYPPKQTYLDAVVESDVVIVLLGDNVRDGTREEIELAVKKKKDILLIKLDSNEGTFSKEIKNAESTLHENGVNQQWANRSVNQTNYASEAGNVVIESVIEYFYHANRPDFSAQDLNDTVSPEMFDGVSKDAFSFKKARFDVKNPFEDFDSSDIKSSAIAHFIKSGQIWDLNTQTDFLDFELDSQVLGPFSTKRWQVNIAFHNAEFNRAKTLAQELLSEYGDKIPNWLKLDVMIQLRNIESKLIAQDGNWRSLNPFQDELTQMNVMQQFPIFDKFISNALAVFQEDMHETRHVGHFSVRFSNKIYEVLNNLWNALYFAAVLGSDHFMRTITIYVARVYIEYGEAYDDSDMSMDGIRVLISHSEWSALSDYLGNLSAEIRRSIAENSDELFMLGGEVPSNVTKYFEFWRHYYQFLSDTNQKKMRRIALTLDSDKRIDGLEAILKLVENHIDDFAQFQLLQIWDNIVQRKDQMLTNSRFKIFQRIDFLSENVDSETVKSFVDTVNKNYSDEDKLYLMFNQTFAERIEEEGAKLKMSLSDKQKAVKKLYMTKSLADLYEVILLSLGEAELELITNPGTLQSVTEILVGISKYIHLTSKDKSDIDLSQLKTRLKSLFDTLKTTNLPYRNNALVQIGIVTLEVENWYGQEIKEGLNFTDVTAITNVNPSVRMNGVNPIGNSVVNVLKWLNNDGGDDSALLGLDNITLQEKFEIMRYLLLWTSNPRRFGQHDFRLYSIIQSVVKVDDYGFSTFVIKTLFNLHEHASENSKFVRSILADSLRMNGVDTEMFAVDLFGRTYIDNLIH